MLVLVSLSTGLEQRCQWLIQELKANIAVLEKAPSWRPSLDWGWAALRAQVGLLVPAGNSCRDLLASGHSSGAPHRARGQRDGARP